MEFKEYKLADITKKIYSGGTPSTREPSYWNGDLKWLSSGETSNRFIMSTEKTITQKGVENSSTKLAFKHDLVMASAGQGYTRGQTSFLKIDTYINQSLIAISVNKDEIHPLYLFYNLVSRYDELRQISDSSSTRGSINTKMIKNLNIMIPEKIYQNRIVYLINSIDEKIEINKKIIANLEELSQTLFKRWFVDFEFPDENGNPYKSSGGEMIDSELGNIPRDWEVNELGNYVDIIKGLSYKGAFLDKQHERSDSFPLLSISNFNFISGFKSNKTKYYFGDYKERHLVNPGDILIAATDLTQDRKILGAPAIIPNLNKTMIFSLDVFKITETTIPKYVLYFLLQSAKYREFVEGSATGTTVIRIAKNVILKVPIVIDKDISLKFDNLIKPYMEKIEHLSQENQKLTQLRDTLLPKLMSGEIEIPDDIEVNEDELSI
ncbi:restriction endonuclease subunit S [Mammaliicoccus sciuri]|uniref:restriction endonuclease subunit S n=1 Tax=Mammaliicoccus sciuri TaxID=1296 RepID=UPI001F19E8D9|nr:restriction endonuclease subunit S [Mammaliicoccus sciuri]MCE5041847.1 restriction endonuclease subunit S [Mammaliicoccus sciuri]